MRDRWVSLYLLFVLVQVPLYFHLGREATQFDFATKAAEKKLRTSLVTEEERESVDRSLDEAELLLEQAGDVTSRRARIELDRAILAWKSGQVEEAIAGLERSRELFEAHHGHDSFHSAAVDLRIGELLYLQNRHNEALIRFQRSGPSVREYLGPRDQFPVRMSFREVCILVALGRNGEAAELAEKNLPYLYKVAHLQDDQFLQMTGGCLNILTRKGLLRSPPEDYKSWKPLLDASKKAPGAHREESD
jgi:hypothetical protein